MTAEWERAVHDGSLDELQRLLSSGADINARDRHGQTALMLAAIEGHGDVVAWLVERGAALDHTAKYGLSALMLAVIGGHVGVVRRLISAGADVNLRGAGAPGFAGKTALDLAIARDDREIVEILGSTERRGK
jgi:ankyrin repeat protein